MSTAKRVAAEYLADLLESAGFVDLVEFMENTDPDDASDVEEVWEAVRKMLPRAMARVEELGR